VSAFESPVHPFHSAVGNRAPNQKKLLVADGWEFFGNALDGAMRLLEVPAVAVFIEAADRHISLFSPQARESIESILKGSIAELQAVLLCFPFRLALQELLESVFRKAGSE
jgi:hypothetical protein